MRFGGNGLDLDVHDQIDLNSKKQAPNSNGVLDHNVKFHFYVEGEWKESGINRCSNIFHRSMFIPFE